MQILRPKGGRSKAGSVWRGCFAVAALALGLTLIGETPASADNRSLRVLNLHTREKAEIVFKRNGRYDQDGLKKLNYILRDWRKNEPTRMDPRLFDLIWEAYRQSGSREYINVVCGYRSPATNSMLRSRSKGVAKKSQHMLGRAMDFFIPGVPLKKLRAIGLTMQGGGVGYYPTSGSPFVHLDVGNVRHWPKMSRKELIALFPNGKTLHVPSDGKPLPGFDQALASYQARKKSGEMAIAGLASGGSSSSSSSGGKSWLASLFGGGGGADDEEDSVQLASTDDEAGDAQPVARAKPARSGDAEVVVASAKPTARVDNKIRILSPDQADRADIPAVEEQQETIVAALPDREVPLPAAAPRPQVDVGMTGPAGLYGAPGEQPAAEPAQEVALGIPLPKQRPDYAPPPELAGEGTLVATVGPDMPVPETRPAYEGEDEIATTIAALPQPSPGEDEDAEEDQVADAADTYTVASLPATAPEALDAAFPTTPKEIIPEARSALGEELAYASPRAAVVHREPGTDPVAALIPTVKTTTKGARPTRNDLKKVARQPVVLAAQPDAARWALDNNYIAENSKGITGPSTAFTYVHSAPEAVYTAGFQQGAEVADSRRFSGKAVTFLTVAKFRTN